MKRFCISILCVFTLATASTQNVGQTKISEMKWGLDYNLHVKLSNDTNYVVDVRGLYHTGKNLFVDTTDQSTTYYPVKLDGEFIQYLKNQKLSDNEGDQTDSIRKEQPKTLWSALHKSAIPHRSNHEETCVGLETKTND